MGDTISQSGWVSGWGEESPKESTHEAPASGGWVSGWGDAQGPNVPKETERTILGTAGDILVSGAKGVVETGKAAVGLADIATMGRAGKFMEDTLGYDPQKTNEVLSSLYTDAQKEANRKAYEAQGFFGKAKAMVQNPSTIGHAIVETIPSMIGGQAIGKSLVKTGSKIAPFVYGAIGEGVISGASTAEDIRQQTEDGFLTPKQAAIPILSGAGTALFGMAGGRLAQRFGFIDVDSFLIKSGSTVKPNGVIKRIVGGGISEGAFEELPQSVQEVVWMNAAMDKPLTAGVPESAAQGLIVGTVMGGGINVVAPGKVDTRQTNPEDAISGDPLAAQENDQFLNDYANQQNQVDEFQKGILDQANLDSDFTTDPEWTVVHKADALVKSYKESTDYKTRDEAQQQIEAMFSPGTPFNEGLAELEANIAEFRRVKARDAAAEALEAHQEAKKYPDEPVFQRGLEDGPGETGIPPTPHLLGMESIDNTPNRPFADLESRIRSDEFRDLGEQAQTVVDDGIDISSDAEFVPESVHDQNIFQQGITDNFGRQDVGGEDLLNLRPTFQQDDDGGGDGPSGSPAQAQKPDQLRADKPKAQKLVDDFNKANPEARLKLDDIQVMPEVMQDKPDQINITPQAGSPAEGFTFGIPADNLTPEALMNKYQEKSEMKASNDAEKAQMSTPGQGLSTPGQMSTPLDKKAKPTPKEALTVEREPWEMSRDEHSKAIKIANKELEAANIKLQNLKSRQRSKKNEIQIKHQDQEFAQQKLVDSLSEKRESLLGNHEHRVKAAINQGKIDSHPDYPELSKKESKSEKYYSGDWIIYKTPGGQELEAEIHKEHEDGSLYVEPIRGGNARYIQPSEIVKLTKKGMWRAKAKRSEQLKQEKAEAVKKSDSEREAREQSKVAKKVRPTDILPKSGKPYKTKGAAIFGIARAKAKDTHEAVEVDGGFVGREKSNIDNSSRFGIIAELKKDFAQGDLSNDHPKTAQQLDLFDYKPGKSEKAEVQQELREKQTISSAPISGVDVSEREYHVLEAGDAASLLSYLVDSAQEHAYFLPIDKNGKVLEILQHTVGLRGQSQIDAITGLGRVFNKPNTAGVIFVHNHPSAKLDPSPSDIAILKKISGIANLRNLPVTPMIMGNNEFSVFDAKGEVISYGKLKDTVKKANVPIKERVFKKRVSIDDKRIGGIDMAESRLNDEQDGFLLLNSDFQEVGFLPFPSGFPQKEITARLIAATEKTNASAIIINEKPPAKAVGRRKFSIKISDALLQNDITVIDIISYTKTGVPVHNAQDHNRTDFDYGIDDLNKKKVQYSTDQDLTGAQEKRKLTGKEKINALYQTKKRSKAKRKLRNPQERRLHETLAAFPDHEKTTISPAVTRERKEIKKVVRLFGHKATFFTSNTPEIDRINGFVPDGVNNEIFINTKSREPMLGVIGHETLHQLRRNHPDLYDFLVSEIDVSSEAFAEYYNKFLASRKGEETALTDKEAVYEELIADFAGDQFKRPEFWQKLNEANPSFTQRIIKAVKTIINKIKRWTPRGEQYISNFKESQDALAYAMGEAIKRGPHVSVTENKTASSDKFQITAKGNASTKAFKKWFGKSKVVDENGEPLVVYHGTDAEFTVFDLAKLGSFTDASSAKLGFFFSQKPTVASFYGLGGDAISGIEAAMEVLDTYESLGFDHKRKLIKEWNALNKGKGSATDWGMREGERDFQLLHHISRDFLIKKLSPEEITRAVEVWEFFKDNGLAVPDIPNIYKEGANIKPVYLSIEHPVYIKWTIFSKDSVAAKKQGLGLGDYMLSKMEDNTDGFFIEMPDGHSSPVMQYVAVNPTQIKSIYNRGTFDPTNQDIRFQTTEDLVEAEDGFYQKASDMLMGNIKHWKDKGKNYDPDVSAMAHIFKTTMYNAEKIGGAYKRLWNAIRKQDDHKFAAQRDLWYEGDHSLLESFKGFAGKFKKEYRGIKNYLNQRDIERKGFLVKKKGKEFELLHWKKKNGIRESLGIYSDKEAAWEDGILIEAEESGFSEKGKEALITFRKMSHNLYHHFARNIEEAIKAYETAGKPVPQITIQTEAGETKINLHAAADRMGDLRGSYFPRLRNSGKWRVIGSKNGAANEQQFFDTRVGIGGANSYRKSLERKGYKTEVEKVGKLSEDLFQALKPLLAQQQVLNTALKDMSNSDKQRVLEDANIKARWDGDVFVLSGDGVYNPEVEQAVKHLGGKFKELFLKNSFKGEIDFEDVSDQNPNTFEQKVTDAILHSGGLEVDMDLAFANSMVKQYDAVLKGRGARSRMIARDDSFGIDVVQGYEKDPVIAITQAMQAAAGSEAKSIIAKEGTAAISGRDISWKDYKDQNETGAVADLEKELQELSLASPEDAARKEKLQTDLNKIRQSLIDSYGLTPNFIIKKQREIKKILAEMKSLTKWSDIGKAQELKTQITQAKSGLYEDYLKLVEKRKLNAKTQAKAYDEATGALEDILRNQEFADRVLGTVKGLAVWQYLGFRVSSAAINVTNMVTGVPAAMNGETDNQVSLTRALTSIGKAMKNFVLHRAGKLTGAQKKVYDEIQEKGWDNPVFNREAFDVLSTKLGKGWNFALEKSMWMFGKTEELNRASTIAATYFSMKATHKGKWDHDAMMEKAKDISDKAHGVYSKANRPFHMRGGNLAGRVLQAGYVFRTFEHNYLQEMYRLGFDKKQRKAALYMAFSPAIFGIGATVPMGIAKAITGAFGGDDPEEKLIQLAEDSFGLGGIARNGIMGVSDHGVNLRGSLSTRFGTPDSFMDIFGAPGSVVADIWEGGKNITKGYYQEGFEKIAPAAFGNISKGIRESTEGVTSRSGTPIYFGRDQLKGDSIDMIIRMLSFNPTGISEKKEIKWHEYKVHAKYKKHKSDLYKKLKRFYSKPPWKRNRADLIKIKADIMDFNIEIRDKGIRRFVPPITKKSIKTVLRRMSKPPKRERQRKI